MKPSLDRLSKALDHRFSRPELLVSAMRHRSLGANNNERLEFLGDAVLGFVVADYLFHRFPDLEEGPLTRLRASLVRRETLASLAAELSLDEYLDLGPGELRSGGQSRPSTLADAMEAVIAAVYLDGGYDAAHALIHRLYQQRFDELTPDAQIKDPKTRLQEWLQSRQIALPDYELVEVTGPQHAQQFEVRCQVDALDHQTTAKGKNKRAAEQAAARKMLELLQA